MALSLSLFLLSICYCLRQKLPWATPSLTSSGLAVFTILKAGFVFSGKAGSGLVVARLPDGSWSAPSCIATAGVGWGLQIGAGKSCHLA